MRGATAAVSRSSRPQLRGRRETFQQRPKAAPPTHPLQTCDRVTRLCSGLGHLSPHCKPIPAHPRTCRQVSTCAGALGKSSLSVKSPCSCRQRPSQASSVQCTKALAILSPGCLATPRPSLVHLVTIMRAIRELCSPEFVIAVVNMSVKVSVHC